MKNIYLGLLIAFIFSGCEVLDDIFGGDKSTCQCILELIFNDLEFYRNGEVVAVEDVTTNVNSGELSCEDFFNNPPTTIEFTESVVLGTSNGQEDVIIEYFSINIDDIPEFDIKNAKCVGDIIDDLGG